MPPRLCPVCHDRPAPPIAGECRRCALRRLAAPLVAALRAELPRASLAALTATATEVIRDALVADALATAFGHRERAAEALHTTRVALAQSMARLPWLARQWPAKRTGRRPAEAPAECPTCGYAPCHPDCPGPQYAVPPEES